MVYRRLAFLTAQVEKLFMTSQIGRFKSWSEYEKLYLGKIYDFFTHKFFGQGQGQGHGQGKIWLKSIETREGLHGVVPLELF